MSATIDQRIVDMQFNNGEFEKGIQTSIKSLDDLKKALKLENAEKGIEQLEKTANAFSMSGMEKSVQNIEDRFSMLGIVGMRVIERLTDRVADFAERTMKSLTIDQVTAGWGKFNDKTKAVQQIIAATGKDIEEVNSQLDKLNWFTDETSYNFVDMVNNIGKFTSVGVELEDAVTAMQGISTWAALSGGGINEASRAMYNLSQAMGIGAVKMMDWKSITLANMATKEFKETVIETAKEIGVLDKLGRYRGKQISFENFESTLQYGWFNKDVLLETLKRYGEGADAVKAFKDEYEEQTGVTITASEAMEMMGDSVSDLGLKSFRAAQEAKTFREAIDSIKDAASTKWMSIFENIFGNYEEAKVIWTDLANYLYDIFIPSLENVDDAFKAWHEDEKTGLGWVNALDAVYDILATIKDIIDVVRESFHTMVPGFSVETLQNFTAHLISFADAFRSYFGIVERVLEKIDRGDKTFKGVVEGFDQTLEEGARGDDVKRLQETLVDAGFGEELGKAYVDGIFGPKTKNALKKAQKAMGIKPTGIFDEETRMAFAEFFSPEAVEETVTEYSTGLDQLARIFQGIGSAISFVWNILTLIFRVGGYVLSLFAPIGRVFMEVLAVAGDFLTLITGGLSQETIFARIQTSLAPLSGMIEGAAAWLSAFFATGEDKQDGMLNFWDALNGIITPVKEAFEQIGSVWEKVAAYFSPGSNRNIKKTNKSLQKNGKTFRMVAEDTEDAGEGFLFLEKIFNRISSAFDSVKTSLGTVWNELVALWNSIWGSISSAFSDEGDAADKATGFLGGVLDAISNILASGLSVLAWAAEKIGVVISSIRHWLFGNEETGESGFISKVKKYFEDLDKEFHISDSVRAFWTDTVEPWLQDIKDFLFGTKNEETGQREGGLAYRISSWFTELKESLEGNEQLQAAWRNVKNWLAHIKNTLFGSDMAVNSEEAAENQMDIPIVHNEGLLDRIRRWFRDLKKTLEENETVQSLWTWWTDFLQNVKDVLFGTKNEETGQREGGAIYNIVEWFKNLYNYLKDSETLKTLWEETKKVIAAIWDWLFGTKNEETGEHKAGLAERIGGFFSGLIDTFSNVHSLDEAFQAAKLVIQDIKNWLRSLFGLDPVYDSSIGTVELGHFGQQNESGGLGNINSGLQSLSDSFSEVETKSNTIGEITERVKTKWEEIKENVSGAFENLGIDFGKAFEGLELSVNKVWSAVKIIGVIVLVYKFISRYADILKSQAAKKAGSWAPLKRTMSQQMLDLGLAILAIASAMLIISNIDPERFDEAAASAAIIGVALGAIEALIIGLDKIKTKNPGSNLGQIGKSILQLALAMVMIAGTIFLISFIPQKNWEEGAGRFIEMGKWVAGFLGAIMAIDLFKSLGTAKGWFSQAQNSFNLSSVGKMLLMISGAIALIGGTIALISQVPTESWETGKSRVGELAGAIATFLASLELTSIIESGMEKLGAIGKVDRSGFESYAKTLLMISAAIGIVGGVIWGLAQIDEEEYKKGSERAAALALVIAGFLGAEGIGDALTKIKAGTGKGLDFSGMTKTLIAIGALIGAMAVVVWLLGGIDDASLAKGEWALGIITGCIISLSTVFGVLAFLKIDLGKLWGTAAVIGLAIDSLIVIVGALIVGMGHLVNASDGWVMDDLTAGGEVLQKIADALSGPFEGNFEKAMTAAAAIIGASTVIGMIPGAAAGTLAGSLTIGGAFGILVGIVGGILAGIGAINDAISTYTGGKGVAAYIDSGGEVLGSISGALAKLATGFTDEISRGFTVFAGAISELREAVDGLSDEVPEEGEDPKILTDISAALNIATVLYKYFSTLVPYSFTGAGQKISGYATAASQLSTDLGLFSEGISLFRKSVAGLDDEKTLEDDTKKAVDVAKVMHDFFVDLQPYNVATDSLAGYYTAPAQLATDMTKFAWAIMIFRAAVKGAAAEDIETDTTSAITSASQIHRFFQEMSREDAFIETDLGFWEKWTGGKTNLQKVLSRMGEFGGTFSELRPDLGGLSEGTFSEDVDVAIAVANRIVSMLQRLKKFEDEGQSLNTGDNSFAFLTKSLGDFGYAVGALRDSLTINNVDESSIKDFETITTGIWNAAKSIYALNNFVGPSTNGLSELGDMFTGIGGILESGVFDNINVESASKTLDKVVSAVESVQDTYKDRFDIVGQYVASGFAEGISKGESGAIQAAIDLATAAIEAAKTTLGEASPSKVFHTIGRFVDEGLANGISDNSDVPENAMALLSESLISDMDGTPVIRPIVDLSEVTSGAKTIDGLMNRNGSIGIDASTSRKQASMNSVSRKQSGTSLTNSSTNYDDSINFSGITFNIRSDQDIRDLASELASLTKRTNRSMGAV